MYADLLLNDKVVVEINGPSHFVTSSHLRKPIDILNKNLIIHKLGLGYTEIN